MSNASPSRPPLPRRTPSSTLAPFAVTVLPAGYWLGNPLPLPRSLLWRLLPLQPLPWCLSRLLAEYLRPLFIPKAIGSNWLPRNAPVPLLPFRLAAPPLPLFFLFFIGFSFSQAVPDAPSPAGAAAGPATPDVSLPSDTNVCLAVPASAPCPKSPRSACLSPSTSPVRSPPAGALSLLFLLLLLLLLLLPLLLPLLLLLSPLLPLSLPLLLLLLLPLPLLLLLLLLLLSLLSLSLLLLTLLLLLPLPF